MAMQPKNKKRAGNRMQATPPLMYFPNASVLYGRASATWDILLLPFLITVDHSPPEIAHSSLA
jgi:hypothetical protein